MQTIGPLLSVALACGLLGPLSVAPSIAAAAFSKTQPPGFFRTAVGDIEVTALYDGFARTDVVKALAQPAADTEAALTRAFLHNPVDTSDNAFLLNTGAKLILVDSGGGEMLGPTLGRLLQNLRAAGYAPEQVDDILLTHLHRDHIGGLITNGQAAFPNATIHVDKREADFWLSPDNLEKAPADQKPRFEGAAAAFAPYIASGHLQTFAPDSELFPGVHAMAAPGHSVGHTVYVIDSKGRSLWLIGDLVNVAAVQLERPDISTSFDGDRDAAAASRRRILQQAAGQSALIAGAHLPFPGLGHLGGAEATWRWIPLDYAADGR